MVRARAAAESAGPPRGSFEGMDSQGSDSQAADPLNSPRKYWDEQSLGDPSRFLVMVGLMRLTRRSMATVDDVLHQYGLNRTSYLLLMALQLTPTGSRMLSRLARDLLVHPTTVTLTIDRFEHDGLVFKAPHETDARATRAHITDSGRALARKITEELAEVGFGLEGLSDAQTAKLDAAITTARAAVGDLIRKPDAPSEAQAPAPRRRT
jgi:DNA-binding MarR family transcriptional regulator